MRICIGANDMADITNFVQKKVNDNEKNCQTQKDNLFSFLFLTKISIKRVQEMIKSKAIFSHSRMKF